MPDIVLRDRNGNHLNFYGAEYLDAVFPDGTEIPYAAYAPETLTPENLASGVTVGDVVGTMSAPILLEDLPIELNFSGGNQSVAAPDGYAVKNAIIQQPANLVPANIAEGVDIAGIVGALAAGGKDVKMSAGKFTTTGVVTVEHGLGVTPDMIWAFGLTTLATDSGLRSIFGTTFEVREQCGLESWFVQHGCYYTKGVLGVYIKNASITKVDSANPLNSANETSFIIGTANYPCKMEMYWLAIGGLT